MELNERELEGGKVWLLGAGLAALCLSFFLFRVDEYVSKARERDIAYTHTLRDLRLAQAGIPSLVSDDRQTMPFLKHEDTQSGASTDHHGH